MSEEYKFKCLLEYFVAHLEYAENGMSDTIGFNRYLKDIVDTSNFKISGYGWKGQQIQFAELQRIPMMQKCVHWNLQKSENIKVYNIPEQGVVI